MHLMSPLHWGLLICHIDSNLSVAVCGSICMMGLSKTSGYITADSSISALYSSLITTRSLQTGPKRQEAHRWSAWSHWITGCWSIPAGITKRPTHWYRTCSKWLQPWASRWKRQSCECLRPSILWSVLWLTVIRRVCMLQSDAPVSSWQL